MHIVQQLGPYQLPASTLTTSIVLTTYPLPSSHHQSIFTTTTTLFSYYNCTRRTPLAIASLSPNLHQSHNPNNTNKLGSPLPSTPKMQFLPFHHSLQQDRHPTHSLVSGDGHKSDASAARGPFHWVRRNSFVLV